MNQIKELALNYFDAVEEHKPELYFDLLEPIVHVINTVSHQKQSNQTSINAIPALSMEAGLELLKTQDMEVNLALKNQYLIIMDTGASLSITVNKKDFVPDTYQEVTSLKLRDMAVGASIEGVADVSW